MTLHIQFLTMITMILGGIYLGAALDTFRRLTSVWAKKTGMSYILEGGFWLTQTTLLFYVLFRVNGGELRFYVFLACLLGFSIYQVGFSTLYKHLLEGIISFCQTISHWMKVIINRLLFQPLYWLGKVFYLMLFTIFKGLATVMLVALKVIYIPILWLLRAVYQILPKSIKNIIYQFGQIYSTIKSRCKSFIKIMFSKRR